MTLTTGVVVCAGATVGSVLRYSIGQRIAKVARSDFPWGTWVINVTGALLLGLFFRELRPGQQDLNWWVFLGTGFCGGFTTFSTLSVETLRLMRLNKRLAAVYVFSSLGLGCLLSWTASVS
ncbi:fluoride efflux transporter CrcB [Alicyclobacillus herbarius]|uniref:fluoride efflux transporter CrcB n=1 Tax=Alicyclobacillus herbarius TaxID=122960 RepID=UPI00041EAED8|nr:fluoride efflux transporter CrcB [Alicyclobacillus herbarius]